MSLVLDFLAAGMSVPEVMEEYELAEEEVLACIAYGAQVARDRFVDIPLTPAG